MTYSQAMSVMKGWILALAAALLAPAFAETPKTEVNEGRAVLLVEDFKLLVGIKAREISSETTATTNSVPGTRPLHLQLSAGDTQRIRSRLARIETQRLKLSETLEKKTLEKKQALREGRRSLQMARMKTPGMEDSKLGRSLFESLLEEANLDTEAQRALETFDEKNQIEIAYVEQDGVRIVQAIEIGNQAVWKARATTGLARR